MRLRVVELPADAYLLIVDNVSIEFLDHHDKDWFRALGDTTTERSGGKCHGMLFFNEAVEFE